MAKINTIEIANADVRGLLGFIFANNLFLKEI